jgi:hypothetical protein
MSGVFDVKFFWQFFVTLLVIMDPAIALVAATVLLWLTMRFSGVGAIGAFVTTR